MCLLSECRGTERGVVMTAQDSSPGMPSSAHCLLHGSIAAKETQGGTIGGLLLYILVKALGIFFYKEKEKKSFWCCIS